MYIDPSTLTALSTVACRNHMIRLPSCQAICLFASDLDFTTFSSRKNWDLSPHNRGNSLDMMMFDPRLHVDWWQWNFSWSSNYKHDHQDLALLTCMIRVGWQDPNLRWLLTNVLTVLPNFDRTTWPLLFVGLFIPQTPWIEQMSATWLRTSCCSRPVFICCRYGGSCILPLLPLMWPWHNVTLPFYVPHPPLWLLPQSLAKTVGAWLHMLLLSYPYWPMVIRSYHRPPSLPLVPVTWWLPQMVEFLFRDVQGQMILYFLLQ